MADEDPLLPQREGLCVPWLAGGAGADTHAPCAGPGAPPGGWKCQWEGPALTQVAEHHGQEDEAVQQAQQRDEQVESEEEDLDELGLGQAQDEDAGQVRHGHAGKHLGVAAGVRLGTRWPAGTSRSVPLLTALPMEMVASLALSSRVGLVLMAKDRVMWDTNSTEMPTACGQRGDSATQGPGQSRNLGRSGRAPRGPVPGGLP